MWNGQESGEGRGWQMGEFPGDEVGHGDEVFDMAIAARPCARLLEGSIHRFDPTVVFARLEPVEYARKMLGDREHGQQSQWYLPRI